MSDALVPPVWRLLKRLRLKRPVSSGPLTLTHAEIAGQPVIFCTDMQNDLIQKSHRKGRFYEGTELDWLRAVFPQGGMFVDIGANVGNHTLFAALILKAGRVIPLEPNKPAYDLLVQNVLVNRLGDIVDLSKLGVGVSDRRAGGYAMEPRARNLGASRMQPDAGELDVYPAYELLAGERPDLIKIDVEGMEMEVLSGLEPVLETCRPLLLVEVDNDNEAGFFAWAEAQGYGAVMSHQRYPTNQNHLLADAAQVADLKAALAPHLGAENQAEPAAERRQRT